jgi:hypothetical protein
MASPSPTELPAAASGAEPRPWLRRSLRLAGPLALFLYVAVLYGATASLQQGLFERDGYYHARVSQLFPQRGLSRHFPWTEVSTWRDGYCDKEVLYHAAMAPFANLGHDPLPGARLFAVLVSLSVVVALYLVLRAHGARAPAWFAALPLASGGLFVARLGMIRSHVLSMALLVVGLHFLLERRARALLVLGALYAWCYTVPFVLVLTAVPYVVGVWLGRGGLDWRSALFCGVGAVLGLVVHPYSPLTLETFLTYLQVFRIGLAGVGSSGFELGNEIYPYPLPVFWDIYPLILLLVPALCLTVALLWRRLSAETKGLTLAALFWFGMTMASARFVEYHVLLLTAACALLVRDLAPAMVGSAAWRAAPRRLGVALGLAAMALLVGFHLRSLRFYRVYQTAAAPPAFFTGAADFMSRHLAPQETVINLYWDDFPDLFYAAPRQHYLWGLDPTYTIRFDEERAVLLERSRRHLQPLDGEALASAFSSRWLILRASRSGGYPELTRPPFREVYRDEKAVLYRIEEAVRGEASPKGPADQGAGAAGSLAVRPGAVAGAGREAAVGPHFASSLASVAR